MSELLSGIRVIKFFSWESFFYNRAKSHRTQELKFLRGRKYLVRSIVILQINFLQEFNFPATLGCCLCLSLVYNPSDDLCHDIFSLCWHGK